MILRVIYCVLLYLPEALVLERSLIITTTTGPIKGKINRFNNIEYYSYQGIPYAENPTGNLRFMPPVPKEPWNNTLDATKEGAICSQLPRGYFMEKTTEDCLKVNVFVPANGTHKLLPVMVFIHGGVLQYLSGNIDCCQGPQFLLEREIIFVTMNFRLGPFGFLSLGIEEASGNAGLKDILLCLKWVKENIKRFGGDPNKVTIAGHSSGSLIVNYFMLTEKSSGLFNQAILLSGSAFSPRSFARHSKEIAFSLVKELGIETDDVYETLNQLQKIDASELLRAYENMSETYDSPLRIYAPFVVSKEVESDHALFTDEIESFRKNNTIPQKVPALVGITAQEAISIIPYIFSKTSGIEKLRENPENFIPSNIEYPMGSQRSKDLGRMISEMYFGGEYMRNLTLTTLIEFISDTQYIFGVNYWVKKYKNMVDSNALYFYIFDFIGDLNRCNMFFKSSVNGSCHGDDIQYFFLTDASRNVLGHIDERTKKVMDLMINFISNFIHYGNPTPDSLNNDIKWPDYGKEQNYLLLNENPVAAKFNSNVLYPRMQFWEKVYDDYYDYMDNGGEIQKKIIP
ncbi:venom carboxylesterase-6-like [Epargyreus clarus]|uniref:venom carboxylesterase-6-like n=1 Tax=Epargyreus clarus TaxID=520877 RepID=UPI003C2D7D2E